MKPSGTYILERDMMTQRGEIVDLVTERWQADGRWVVGERSKNGATAFYHRSFPSLSVVCAQRGLKPASVRKRRIKMNES